MRSEGSDEVQIRAAEASDAAACAAIYGPFVEGSVISFEEVAPDAAEMRRRIEVALVDHAWLVIEIEGRVAGYAYAGPHKERRAYRWACEVSVYLEPGHHGEGLGRLLYLALFERLADRGFLTVVAGMTLPNPASVGLHRSLGFEEVGTWRRIGYKHGAWRDVTWMQRTLAELPETPAGPS